MVINGKKYYKQIIIVGTGKFALSCARIAQKYCETVKIYEKNMNSAISTLKSLCYKYAIEHHCIQEDCLYKYLSCSNENILVISAFNTYIFDERFFEISNIKMINYHPALLPMHPGRNSEAWSIYNQDKITGITWHEITRRVDKGNIIGQVPIELNDSYTSLKLMMEQNFLGIKELEVLLPILLEGRIESHCQENKKTIYHKSSDIPNNGYLNMEWEQSLKYSFLRAMDYGKLYVLGVPKLIVNSNIYVWNAYEFIKDESEICLDKCDMRISENIVLRGVRRYIDE